MKKCLIKGMTVIMISTMLASIPVVSYAAETEPKNLTESAVPESDVQNAVNTVDIPETDKESETGGQLPQEQPPQEQPPQEQPPPEQPPQAQTPEYLPIKIRSLKFRLHKNSRHKSSLRQKFARVG